MGIRVGILSSGLFESAGWARYTYEVVSRLSAHDVEPVAFIDRRSTLRRAQFEIGGRMLSGTDGWLKGCALRLDSARLGGQLRTCRLLHCFAEPYLPLAARLSAPERPLIVNAVGTYSIEGASGRWGSLYRDAFLKAVRVLPLSRYTGDRILTSMPSLARGQVEVIPNGVALDILKTHQGLPLEKREMAAAMVGPIKPRKGTLLVAQALARVAREVPDFKLYIVGKIEVPDYGRQVQAELERSGLKHSVVIRSGISDEELWELMGRVRMLVNPSQNVGRHFEGYGLVHVEAHLMGTPSIGSKDCGNEDSVEDGVTGFTVPQRSAAGIAEAMLKLLQDDRLWERLSGSARRSALDLGWDRIVERYVRVYRSILER